MNEWFMVVVVSVLVVINPNFSTVDPPPSHVPVYSIFNTLQMCMQTEVYIILIK